MKIDPWLVLAAESNHTLISKLSRAVSGEPGFGTIVVKEEGFSKDNETHNAIMAWLRKNGVHVIDVQYEVGTLELALLAGRPKSLESSKP
jgi:hypothetical protein